MRSPHYLRPNQVSLNLTPMIDVVFLLIIFFLVSNNLMQQENAVEIPLPFAKTANIPDEDSSRKEIINVPAPGKLLLRNEPISLEELKRYLLKVRRERGEKNVEVVLRAAQYVPYQDLEPILLACTEAGIWNFYFATVEGGLK